MEIESRNFIRRVLIIHFGLLLLLLAIVAVAVRVLQTSARTQALDRARQTQELVAQQTATALRSYYESVTSNLDLMKALQMEALPSTRPGVRPPPFVAPTEPNRRRLSERIMRDEDSPLVRFAHAVWSTMESRASILFLLDRSDPMGVVAIFGAEGDSVEPELVIDGARDWLGSVQNATISPFLTFGERRGHLIALPVRGSPRLLLVAVVPIDKVERQLLSEINASRALGGSILDEKGMFVSNMRHGDLVGQVAVVETQDPRIKTAAEKYPRSGVGGTELFDFPTTVGDSNFEPAMITLWPAEVLGKRWWVLIGSDLSEVDRLVNPIFRDAMLWALWVMLTMTAILVSTSVQLIRGRMRVERFKHEVLTREISQAREIQLAWLPDATEVPDGIEIAAINHPAHHISGDFYNWFELPLLTPDAPQKCVLVIGDVTGHGMSAAFLMATTQLLVRNLMSQLRDPGQCLGEVNRQLCTQVFNGQFVTMLILVIEPDTGAIEAANSGHPPPLICAEDECVELHIEPELVLGVELGYVYPTVRAHLPPGASMLLYTDGVTDVINPKGRRYSMESIRDGLHGPITDASSMIARVMAAIDTFRAGAEIPDDITLVAVRTAASDSPKPPEISQVEALPVLR
jgi:serine phosphatase RsbU (regulator of sigma subunit)